MNECWGSMITFVVLVVWLSFKTFPLNMRRKYGKKHGWACESCGKTFHGDKYLMEFHHRIPTNAGGQDTYENMEMLCQFCHLRRHIYLRNKGGHKNSPRLIRSRIKRTGGKRDGW